MKQLKPNNTKSSIIDLFIELLDGVYSISAILLDRLKYEYIKQALIKLMVAIKEVIACFEIGVKGGQQC
jgi:hypothetical protein